MAEKDTAAKTVSKKEKAPKKKGSVGKFFRGYISEMRKVSWPTRKQVINNTIITLIFVALIGLFIWVLDVGLVWLRDFIFDLDFLK